jgi:hypothetical protein
MKNGMGKEKSITAWETDEWIMRDVQKYIKY